MSYRLEVVVTDDGSCCKSGTSRSRRGAVVVQVKDVNNNAPRFPDCSLYSPTVTENENVGTTVIQVPTFPYIYSHSVSQPPPRFSDIFPKRLGIFSPNFKCLLNVPVYAGLPVFVQLPATAMKLRHIKRDHPVHIICSKCPRTLGGLAESNGSLPPGS